MYEYRRLLMQRCLGATDREVDRAQLIGRAKVAHIRQLAAAQGWLEPSGLTPDDAQRAAVFKVARTSAQAVFSVEPNQTLISRTSDCRAFCDAHETEARLVSASKICHPGILLCATAQVAPW